MLLRYYNPYIPNIDAISGALITFDLSLLILNSQCEEGARDGIDIWYMGINIFAYYNLMKMLLDLEAEPS